MHAGSHLPTLRRSAAWKSSVPSRWRGEGVTRLGREEGGSGVPLEREKYDASVQYWKEHAPIL